MEAAKIIIYSQNKVYGERLYRYLEGKKSRSMKFFLATGQEGFRRLLEQERISGVLLDKEFSKTLGEIPHPIWLVEKKTDTADEIYMYQKGSCIYKKLQSVFAGKVDENETEMICVFSPEGTRDKTEFALSVCRERLEKGGVVYVSLSGFPVLFSEELTESVELSEGGLSKLMFEMSEKNFSSLLPESSFMYEGIRVLIPFWHYKDLLDVELEDIKRFFGLLRKEGDCRTIIVEMGQLFEYTFEVMELSDEIMIPMNEGIFDQIRLNVLRGYCRMEGREELVSRFRVMIEEREEYDMYDEVGG